MVKRKQSRNGYILQNQSKLRQNGLQKSLMILSIKIPGTKPGIFLETFQKSPDDQFFFIIQKSDQSFVLLCNSIYDMILILLLRTIKNVNFILC